MFSRRQLAGIKSILAVILVSACGSQNDGGSETIADPDIIKGQVIGTGWIEGALVCHDKNLNGQCDWNETRTLTDANGAFEVPIPRDSESVLIAEIGAGQAQDSTQMGEKVERSFRMASPSNRYSTNITPFSTMVYLAKEEDFLLAEDEVRNTLGLPPRYDIKQTGPANSGSLSFAVGSAVVEALKAVGSRLDLSAIDAGERVVAAFPPSLSALPQIRITTENAAPIDSKITYVNATYTITNPLFPGDSATLTGKIRGRGNSTWGNPKNPYKVQFTNDSNYSKISDFFGMKKNTNWALLADYFDRTLLRNKLALSLGSSSIFSEGLKWNPSGQHVEVFLNDTYIGVYLFTEDIRIDPVRLPLKKMSSSPVTNDVDGGYIVEVDVRLDCYYDNVIDLRHFTAQNVPFCIKKPDEDSITQNQISYITQLLDGIENEMYTSNKTSRLNLISFVDWYIIQELFRNVDANFFSSVYLWIDTTSSPIAADRLLNMGPLWDFDRSAGNVNYFDGWMTEGCWINNGIYRQNWMSQLVKIPEFRDLLLRRWKQKRPALEKYVNNSIETFSYRLNLPQQRNFATWRLFGVPLTNYYSFSNYADEVAFLKSFLNSRMAWLDKAFANAENFDALCR